MYTRVRVHVNIFCFYLINNIVASGYSQAILKKTNYKRPSLDGRSIQYSSDTTFGNDGSISNRTYNSKQSDVVQYKTKDYGQPAADNVKRSKDYKNELNQQLSKSTRTELLPGIVLEGSSYDL